MSLYAADGSINIHLDDTGSGLYTGDGHYRATTYVDGDSGAYAPDGSYLVIVDDSSEVGLRHSSGALRVSTEEGSGVYDTTGALRITVDNPPEE